MSSRPYPSSSCLKSDSVSRLRLARGGPRQAKGLRLGKAFRPRTSPNCPKSRPSQQSSRREQPKEAQTEECQSQGFVLRKRFSPRLTTERQNVIDRCLRPLILKAVLRSGFQHD